MGIEERVFGEPYERADGSTVITVAGLSRTGGAEATPLGVFVVRNGKAEWSPVVDGTKIAVLGVLTGLVAATLACVALIRRQPWPDVRIRHDSSRAALPPGRARPARPPRPASGLATAPRPGRQNRQRVAPKGSSVATPYTVWKSNR
jgi:hypothetical protein